MAATQEGFDLSPFLRAGRLLVVDLGFLGDSVHLIPALRALREACSEAELHVVSTPVGCAVLRLAEPDVRFWELELNPARRSMRAQWRLIRALRAQHFDAAVNLSAVDRSILLTYLSGARHRLAHLSGREHVWNRWLIPHWAPRQSSHLPIYQQRLNALRAVGFPVSPQGLELAPPEEERGWAEAHVPRGAIHFSLNASSPMKEWPLEHYAELARRCLAGPGGEGRHVVVSGTRARREQRRISEFVELARNARISALPPDTSLAQLAAALARCRLHVGPDSGVIHLATALGVPTVALFRKRGEYAAWVPQGRRHRHFLATCDCPDGVPEACRAVGYARCLRQVAPERVARACLELLTDDTPEKKPRQQATRNRKLNADA